MIGSPLITGIFAQEPADGIPEGIDASAPDEPPSGDPEEDPPSWDPDEDPASVPEELPLVLPDDELPPLEEPLLDVDPLPEEELGAAGPVSEVDPHEAKHATPTNVASAVERTTSDLMAGMTLHEACLLP
jgi:hypothetical protein